MPTPRKQAALLAILREARALIAGGWTQRTYARTAEGQVCGVDSERAACFCPVGAILRVARGRMRVEEAAIYALEAVTPGGHVMGWNEAPERTQAQVLTLFDAAEIRQVGIVLEAS